MRSHFRAAIPRPPETRRFADHSSSCGSPLRRLSPGADIYREKPSRNTTSNCSADSTGHTLLAWVRSRACSKSSQMSGGKVSSDAVMRFIAMRLAVFTTP